MSGDHNQFQKAKSYVDEPVAWMHTTGTGHVYFRKKPQDKVFNPRPVFTAPPKKPWVGLTDEDIHDAFNFTEVVKQLSWDREPVRWCENFSAYIEAKLKEKNHG